MTEVNLALRKAAEQPLQEGCYGFMRAFDLTNNEMVTWQFDTETRKRAADLLQELVSLFVNAPLRPKPGYVAELRAIAAKGDTRFQSFLDVVTHPRRRRAPPNTPQSRANRSAAMKASWARRRGTS